LSGSDPVRHGSRGPNGGDDGVGAALEEQVEEAAAAHQADAAAQQGHEAVEIQRRLEGLDNFAITMHNIARGYLFLGELDDARDALAQSFSVARELGYRQVAAYCVEGLSELAMREGDAERPPRRSGRPSTCSRRSAQ
jgi:hypothetical protein